MGQGGGQEELSYSGALTLGPVDCSQEDHSQARCPKRTDSKQAVSRRAVAAY